MRISTTSRQPSSSAVVRLWIAVSMNVAGRKIVASIVMSGRPGRIASIASSRPCVSFSVFAPGYFWTTSSRPGPLLTTASPPSGWCSSRRVATSETRRRLPSPRSMTTLPRSAALSMPSSLRTFRRTPPVSTKPPLPMNEPSEKRSSPESSESPVAFMTSSSDTPLRASFFGSTSTCCCCRRSPQIATFATPGTRSRRWRIFQ